MSNRNEVRAVFSLCTASRARRRDDEAIEATADADAGADADAETILRWGEDD